MSNKIHYIEVSVEKIDSEQSFDFIPESVFINPDDEVIVFRVRKHGQKPDRKKFVRRLRGWQKATEMLNGLGGCE